MNLVVAVLLLVVLLAGPVLVAPIERNLEIFFLAIGLLSCVMLGSLGWDSIVRAAREPLMITVAVTVAGALFEFGREGIESLVRRLRAKIPVALLAGLSVFVLAALASLVTAIVAAIVLVEVVRLLYLDRASTTRVAVAGCFAIGLGSALTPVGEPLSTLAAAALELGFGGLAALLGLWLVPAVTIFSVLAGWFAHRGSMGAVAVAEGSVRRRTDIFLRGAKIYFFVAGLVLVGDAFEPLALHYLGMFGNSALYWANMMSAVLDNATLVALELHGMDPVRARAAIIALLLSGGMLIPGNIPNIIAAGPLRISSRAWARVGVPLGLLAMTAYFLILSFWAA